MIRLGALAAFAVVLVAATGQPAAAQFGKAREVKKHMEQHDYRVEMKDDHVAAVHDKWLNLTIREYKGGLLFRSWLETTEYKTDDLESLANELNYKATAARVYIDNENDLIYECWLPGEYDRERFEALIEAWHVDTIGQSEIVRNHLNM